jgi:F-type H+-transporting ATPase subunit a
MTQTAFTLAADPISQIVNQVWTKTDSGWWLWSAHVANLLIAGALTWLLISYASSKIGTGPESEGNARYLTKSPLGSFVEVLICYFRDNVVKPFLGDRTEKFLPFLMTLFFFILINNLIGLVPIAKVLWAIFPEWKKDHILPVGMTATQNIYVTAALAAISFVVINIAGIRRLGLGGYLKHLTGEAPIFVWPIMIPIEIAGLFIKPVALAIRLFANMTAGHVLMVVLFTFAAEGIAKIASGSISSVAVGGIVGFASFFGAVAITFLELMVAFIQATVFVFLVTVFIGQLDHHHEHGHEGEHGHEHAH